VSTILTRAGAIDTHFIERHLPANREGGAMPLLPTASTRLRRRSTGTSAAAPWRVAVAGGILSGWRNSQGGRDVGYAIGGERLGRAVAESGVRSPPDARRAGRGVHGLSPGAIALEIDGVRRRFHAGRGGPPAGRSAARRRSSSRASRRASARS
jgi:hypothetical protein